MTPARPVIGIMGASLGTGNRGVSALASGLVKLLAGAAPAAETVMLIGHRDTRPFEVIVGDEIRLVPVVNFRISPKAKIREHLIVITVLALVYRLLPFGGIRRSICRICPWIRTIAEAELVGDIRGGDSFSDIYGLTNFLIASMPVMTVIWIRGDIVLFPQTYGPFRHGLARVTARYILRHASTILSRDKDSISMVRKLIGSTRNVRFCPDVAFAMDPAFPTPVEADPPLQRKAGECLVGLNINGLMYNGGYSRRNMFGLKMSYPVFLAELVEALLKVNSIRIVLIPHTFGGPDNIESDPEACRRVLRTVPDAMRNRVHLVTQEYNQHHIKGVIGGCNFFIGSRLHSTIAALSQGIPTVGVAYSKKFKGLFDSVGAGDWIVDAREMDVESGVKFILARIEERAKMRLMLEGCCAQAREELKETFAALLGRPKQNPGSI